jgi:hypothetical protein
MMVEKASDRSSKAAGELYRPNFGHDLILNAAHDKRVNKTVT